jgi:hypothetical protein
MLQSTTRTQLDQLKVPYQDLKRFLKETILALEIEVVEGGMELKKKTELVGGNRTPTTTTLKVNFEDLEKKTLLTLTEKKPKQLQAEIDAFESTEKIFKVVLIICCLQK